jgi:hypothetical protein
MMSSATEMMEVALKDNPTVAEDVIREAVLGEAVLREAVLKDAEAEILLKVGNLLFNPVLCKRGLYDSRNFAQL